MNPAVRLAAAAFTLFGLSVGLHAQDAVIAKARAYVGPEDALNAVQSIHYIGRMVSQVGTDTTHQVSAQIEIFVKKPDSLRISINSAANIETDGLSDYDGWHRHEVKADPSAWTQYVLGPNSVRQMRANVWENLAFYKSYESDSPDIKDMGTATVDDTECEKVVFEHEGGSTYVRYFEKDTGRLVLTEAGQTGDHGFVAGSELHQDGDFYTFGMRLPKTLTTKLKDPKGGPDTTVTMTFTSITVNEPIPDSIFSPPPPLPRVVPAVPAQAPATMPSPTASPVSN